eukprot:gnl/TRDRNA2_/TRDRNA2_196190_c0_seq1.p1 gnl/TRDRNA2_/TRDRNA2_196190_c0~~gnl/TRDRNA2_/TRDRNA2_196190_c0_seq1.p1  ORF type:complete len:404 (+),score=79.91 gnl/TRDRNA2_/TRDRNA2_196190_c0_seq1:124-1212(+)
MVALPCAIVAGVLKVLQDHGFMDPLLPMGSMLRDAEAYSGFSFLVGFLVVFRTNQAYNRFWEGVGSSCRMQAEWFNAASVLIAFCKAAKADTKKVLTFQHILVRLFSCMHGASVAQIEGKEFQDSEVTLEIIDARGIDKRSLKSLRDSDQKVGLIFQWLQQLIIEAMGTGVLNIPPPILARAFQTFATGMVNFHDAVKITTVPFPFPFAQTTECLMVMHWVVTPLVATEWVKHWAWVMAFTFIQVFILWSLNAIAKEIENPFGDDDNDIELARQQEEFNERLLLLLAPWTTKTPGLAMDRVVLEHAVLEHDTPAHFGAVWESLKETLELDASASPVPSPPAVAPPAAPPAAETPAPSPPNGR